MPEVIETTQGTRARFRETHWSVVLAAGEGETSRAAAALDKLCRAYWQPLYAYVRRRGHGPHDAQDLTQEFFLLLLARQDLARVHPAKGKFRTFLLACLDHFLKNEWHKRQTLKRGGGQSPLQLDVGEAEESLRTELRPEVSPERLFDRRWAVAVLNQAIDGLRREMIEAGDESLFQELHVFLTEPASPAGYDCVAARLGMAPGAVATSVHRLRKRYREWVRGILAETVATPLELEEEMRYLLEVCG